MLYPLPSPGYTSEGLRGHMADLRRKTFRSISFEVSNRLNLWGRSSQCA
jgi:hypothetical protein